jgi:hypothetical protein
VVHVVQRSRQALLLLRLLQLRLLLLRLRLLAC